MAAPLAFLRRDSSEQVLDLRIESPPWKRGIEFPLSVPCGEKTI